jgi:hypothetical protein
LGVVCVSPCRTTPSLPLWSTSTRARSLGTSGQRTCQAMHSMCYLCNALQAYMLSNLQSTASGTSLAVFCCLYRRQQQSRQRTTAPPVWFPCLPNKPVARSTGYKIMVMDVMYDALHPALSQRAAMMPTPDTASMYAPAVSVCYRCLLSLPTVPACNPPPPRSPD